ncbi:YqzE family protein [Amphibacillus sp. Q70]|uniref:YqzE family protein n=1 Tax=Amphibacillus sp. Q70 TaxID=3453416 RepID=UPI003F83D5DD
MADKTFVEFIIDLTIDYYQTPKEERQRLKKERKNQVTSPYSHKWFGLLPSTIKQLKKSSEKNN